MTGTLAIWYEPTAGELSNGEGAVSPSVELHFNLWRDTDTGADFFDVGLRFKQASLLGRVFLFVPTALQPQQIRDLSPVLKHETSLNAVFNDLVEVKSHAEGSFVVEFPDALMRIHEMKVSQHIKLEPVDMDAAGIGTVIAFNDELCKAFRIGPETHYVRFRVYLNRRSAHLFSTEVTPSDWFLLPSFQKVELTEFRLNERRSLPRSLVKRFEAHPLTITTIHYFLIRAQQHELMVQHRDFRKIRVLEAAIWRHYLTGRHPQREVDVHPYRVRQKNRHIIYHWKEKANEETSLEDFNAFAKFSTPCGNLLTYAYTITFLGALGSALYGLVYALTVGALDRWSGTAGADQTVPPLNAMTIAMWSLVALIVLFVAIAAALSQGGRFREWFSRAAERLGSDRD